VRDAPHSDLHHLPVLGENGRRIQPLGLIRSDRHPVDAVRGEQFDIGGPLLFIQQLRLMEEELLDVLLQGGRRLRFREGAACGQGFAFEGLAWE